MQDLTLVGVHDDGEHLVLTGPDGQRFRVQVDEPLRAAVRRDRARLGQLQIEMDGKLRPRDIQARIRAGQTAEEVAAAAGLRLEHVRRFEGPVLAEREFVARQARSVRIRGAATAGTSPALGDLVGERLAAREVDEAGVAWDAWRSDDGAWTVCLSFTAGGKNRRARWTYDTQLRHVTPVDDEARWLTDDPTTSDPLPPRRLAPVRDGSLTSGPAPDRVYDVEADGGVRPADGERAVTVDRPATIDLLDSLRERRGRRQRPAAVSDDDPQDGAAPDRAVIDLTGLTDRETDPVPDRDGADRPGPEPDGPDRDAQELDPRSVRSVAAGPPAAHPARSQPGQAIDAEVLDLPGDVSEAGSAADRTGADPPGVSQLRMDSDTGSEGPGRPDRAHRRSKRASVPSWDDIVFGARRE